MTVDGCSFWKLKQRKGHYSGVSRSWLVNTCSTYFPILVNIYNKFHENILNHFREVVSVSLEQTNGSKCGVSKWMLFAGRHFATFVNNYNICLFKISNHFWGVTAEGKFLWNVCKQRAITLFFRVLGEWGLRGNIFPCRLASAINSLKNYNAFPTCDSG